MMWQRLANGIGLCLGSERISVFHGEASLAHLRRIGRGDTRKLRARVVDDVQIAVGAIVPPEANVGARSLSVRRVYLDNRR